MIDNNEADTEDQGAQPASNRPSKVSVEGRKVNLNNS